jgi:hypothetical protein
LRPSLSRFSAGLCASLCLRAGNSTAAVAKRVGSSASPDGPSDAVEFLMFRMDGHAHEEGCEHREDIGLQEGDKDFQEANEEGKPDGDGGHCDALENQGETQE